MSLIYWQSAAAAVVVVVVGVSLLLINDGVRASLNGSYLERLMHLQYASKSRLDFTAFYNKVKFGFVCLTNIIWCSYVLVEATMLDKREWYPKQPRYLMISSGRLLLGLILITELLPFVPCRKCLWSLQSLPSVCFLSPPHPKWHVCVGRCLRRDEVTAA